MAFINCTLTLFFNASMGNMLSFSSYKNKKFKSNLTLYAKTPHNVCGCRVERSTDQVMKPVNTDALSTWVGHIPTDVMNDMADIAPMLARLGYDPHANPPDYTRSQPLESQFNHSQVGPRQKWHDATWLPGWKASNTATWETQQSAEQRCFNCLDWLIVRKVCYPLFSFLSVCCWIPLLWKTSSVRDCFRFCEHNVFSFFMKYFHIIVHISCCNGKLWHKNVSFILRFHVILTKTFFLVWQQ